MTVTWRDYQPTPEANTAAPPVGAPEGNFKGPAVNDIFRTMMAVDRNLGDTTLKIAVVQDGAFTPESTAGTMALQNADNVNITGGTISIPGIGVPVGGIISFSGTTPATTVSEAAALVGWAICDGRTVSGRTTPDLRNRFLMGWTASLTPGSTIGSTSMSARGTTTGGVHDHGANTGSHALTIPELPPHTHSTQEYAGDSDPSGTHINASVFHTGGGDQTGSTGGTNGVAASHRHTITADTGHTHTVDVTPPGYIVVYIMRVA